MLGVRDTNFRHAAIPRIVCYGYNNCPPPAFQETVESERKEQGNVKMAKGVLVPPKPSSQSMRRPSVKENRTTVHPAGLTREKSVVAARENWPPVERNRTAAVTIKQLVCPKRADVKAGLRRRRKKRLRNTICIEGLKSIMQISGIDVPMVGDEAVRRIYDDYNSREPEQTHNRVVIVIPGRACTCDYDNIDEGANNVV